MKDRLWSLVNPQPLGIETSLPINNALDIKGVVDFDDISDKSVEKIAEKLYGSAFAKAVVICKWCGQWGARFCSCKHCGGPIE
jgi:hypothetical protein